MIFIGGVHGVGKSTFCSLAEKRFGIHAYSSGRLIADYKNNPYLADKKVADIADNQVVLKLALQRIEETESTYLLDGHFCLLNRKRKVEEIAPEVFKELNPRAILVLTIAPSVLFERLSHRDGIVYSVEELDDFQKQEIHHATRIASDLEVPLAICTEIEEGLTFIESQI